MGNVLLNETAALGNELEQITIERAVFGLFSSFRLFTIE